MLQAAWWAQFEVSRRHYLDMAEQGYRMLRCKLSHLYRGKSLAKTQQGADEAYCTNGRGGGEFPPHDVEACTAV